MCQRKASFTGLQGSLELSDERLHLQGNIFVITIDPKMTSRGEIQIESIKAWPLNIDNSVDLPS